LISKSVIQWLQWLQWGVTFRPGSLADRLLTGLGQPQINPKAQKEKEKVYCSAEKGNHAQEIFRSVLSEEGDLLVAGGAAEMLPVTINRTPVTPKKNPPPLLSLSLLCFCKGGGNQHSTSLDGWR